MEYRRADAFALAQHLLQLQRGGRLGADHQHFLFAVAGQVAKQPLDARIKVPPGAAVAFELLINLLGIEQVARALFRAFTRAHNAGDLNGGLILRRQRQADLMQFAFREALHAVTRVAEQHAAGAVAIHQHGDQLFARVEFTVAFAVSDLQQRLDILLAHQIVDDVHLFLRDRFVGQQRGDRVGDRTEVLLLFDKLREVVEAIGIEQTQTGEVTLHSQLFRRRGQQQHAGDLLRQPFDNRIFAARLAFAPGEMVRFVDHHQIPLRLRQQLKALLVAAHEIERANNQLFGLESVVAVVLRFGVAVVVEQREVEVEAAQHLDQPLMLQSFRHDDQHALGAPGQQLLLDNHAGFDGFAEAHFVRQQHARRMAAAHVVGDMQLVRDQVGAHAAQTAYRQTILRALIFARAIAQGEAIHTIELASEQAILGFAEHQLAVEHHFTQHHLAFIRIKTRADIGHQVIFVAYFIDAHLPAFVAGHRIARIKDNASHRRVVTGIQAVFARGRKQQRNHAGVRRHDRSEPQFTFRITNPALT